jgi:tetratricopeptide (TPR) repeat protein
MHQYNAAGLLSWPLSIIDLIDLIEQKGFLCKQRSRRPSMLCMENAQYLMSCWIERKTGTIRENNNDDVFLTLLDGELVEHKGGTIHEICSSGKLRFYDEEISGKPRLAFLVGELLDIARHFNTDKIFQHASDMLLIPDLRAVGLPLSPHTRRFLTETPNGILLSHFNELDIEQIGLIRDELALLKLLGLVTITKPTKSSIDFGPLRHQVLRRLSLLSQNNVAQSLGLPHTADIVQMQRACQRLLHRIGGWLNHSALPADIHDNMRLLQQQLRQQVLRKQRGRTHDRIRCMLSKVNEFIEGENWVKASETLEMLLEVDPSHAQAQSLLGWTWFNGSKQPKVLRKARVLLERSIKLNNQDATSQYYLACLLQELGELDAARKAGRRAIQLRPWETRYLSLLEELEDSPQEPPV